MKSKSHFSKKEFIRASKILNLEPLSAPNKCIVYHSDQNKTKELVDVYTNTDQLSHRYLAYRDLPYFINQYVDGKKSSALDYGSGTGISSDFLYKLGIKVVGIDVNPVMLEKARKIFRHIQFFEVNELVTNLQFDIIFSSFVLFDMKSRSDIISYLSKASSFMKTNGIFIIITASEELYSVHRNWIAYDSDFKENQNLRSGDIAMLRLRYPAIEFHDYFWKESDYNDCFQEAKLKVLTIHRPVGVEEDPYLWQDEKFISPFTVYILGLYPVEIAKTGKFHGFK